MCSQSPVEIHNLHIYFMDTREDIFVLESRHAAITVTQFES